MDETFQGAKKFTTTDLFFKLGLVQSAKMAMIKARNELEPKISLHEDTINSIVRASRRPLWNLSVAFFTQQGHYRLILICLRIVFNQYSSAMRTALSFVTNIFPTVFTLNYGHYSTHFLCYLARLFNTYPAALTAASYSCTQRETVSGLRLNFSAIFLKLRPS